MWSALWFASLRRSAQLEECLRKAAELCASLAALAIGAGAAPRWTSASAATDSGARAVVRAFEARYRPAHTLQATFLEQYSEGGRLVRREAGTAYFRKPGKMRWEYQAPENNLFLVDGKIAWFYVPEDHTVTRVPAKQSSDARTPLALLAGEVKVSRICSRVSIVVSPSPLEAGNVVLQCTLKGTPSDKDAGSSAGQQAFFEVSTASGQLSRVIVRDPGGVEIDYRFKNWAFNPPVPESLFRFEPPAGVAIVNGELPASGSAASR